MGLGDKILDSTYVPEIQDTYVPASFYFKRIVKIPIRFTKDLVEYCESHEFLGIKLRPLQKQFIEELFSTNDDGNQKYNEGVLCCGMRSGKSWTGAFIATGMTQMLLAEDDPAARFKLVKGTRITAQFISASDVQAKETAYAAVDAITTYNDYWRKYLDYLTEREKNEGKETLFQHLTNRIEFKEKNIALLSLNSNSASLAGKASYAVVMDELSRFDTIDADIQSRTQKRTADAVYSTVSRSIMSLKGFGKVITVSSPLYEDDYTMKLVKMAGTIHVGSQSGIIGALRSKEPKKVKTIYAIHATTPEFNPDISMEDLESERMKNPTTFSRDYLAIPPSAISPFFDLPERIEASVNGSRDILAYFEDKLFEETITNRDVREVRRYIGKEVRIVRSDKMMKFFVACDQGETRDAFVVSMGHGEEISFTSQGPGGKTIPAKKYKIIIDLIAKWKPDRETRTTVSFQNVEDVIRTLGKNYYVGSVTYDQWQSTESIQRLFSEGLYTEKLGATLEMYEVFKMLLYSGMVEFPPNDDLVRELKQLNILKGKKIDHPPLGEKDIADSICRVVWQIYNDSIKSAIQENFMLPMSQSMPTIRSVASAYEIMNQDMQQGNYGIFDQANPNTGGLFGRDFIVRGNVVPNLKHK